jgi:hypothetical protein
MPSWFTTHGAEKELASAVRAALEARDAANAAAAAVTSAATSRQLAIAVSGYTSTVYETTIFCRLPLQLLRLMTPWTVARAVESWLALPCASESEALATLRAEAVRRQIEATQAVHRVEAATAARRLALVDDVVVWLAWAALTAALALLAVRACLACGRAHAGGLTLERLRRRGLGSWLRKLGRRCRRRAQTLAWFERRPGTGPLVLVSFGAHAWCAWASAETRRAILGRTVSPACAMLPPWELVAAWTALAAMLWAAARAV